MISPPHVTKPIVSIPPHLVAWVQEIARSSKNERYGLEGGPKDFFMSGKFRLFSRS